MIDKKYFLEFLHGIGLDSGSGFRWKAFLLTFGIFQTLTIYHCSSVSRETMPPHHTESGFQNSDLTKKPGSVGAFISWQVSRLFDRDRPSLDPGDYHFEIQPNDGLVVQNNKKDFSVTWIGHATTLVQIEGVNILTDPIWSERCSPVSFAGPKRYTAPGIEFDSLPEIHIVLISHNHYDHMDLPTLIKLEEKFHPRFYAGLKNRDFLLKEGLKDVVEMDWWEENESHGLKIHFTPTQHFSARGVLDRDKTLWGSYLVEGKERKVYFAGDTGYFDGFKSIGERFQGIDLAILPIGAYEPIDFMSPIHMAPNESVRAFQDLQAKFMVPMHYETFVLTDEALDEPLRLTKELFQSESIERSKLLDLKIGQTHFLYARTKE